MISWLQNLIFKCNSCRYGVVELKLALVNGVLGGAAVDCPEGVTWLEAWVRDIPNLIVTPHIGFFSDQAFAEQRRNAASAVRAFLAGHQSHGGGVFPGGNEGAIGGRSADGFGGGGGTSLVLGGDEEEEEEDTSGAVSAEKEAKEGDSGAFQRL